MRLGHGKDTESPPADKYKTGKHRRLELRWSGRSACGRLRRAAGRSQTLVGENSGDRLFALARIQCVPTGVKSQHHPLGRAERIIPYSSAL